MHKIFRSRLFAAIPLLFILFLLFLKGETTTIFAQQTAADTITADQVNAIARELWCPLCSGVRLDACELKACDQMKEMIAIKLSEGEDLESIRAYFIEQYGPQVLGEPPREGFSWLAWILPVAVMAGGGLLLWLRMRRLVQPAPSAQRDTSQVSTSSGMSDEDAEKLRKELERYG